MLTALYELIQTSFATLLKVKSLLTLQKKKLNLGEVSCPVTQELDI